MTFLDQELGAIRAQDKQPVSGIATSRPIAVNVDTAREVAMSPFR
jgi:hypothetical protein